MLHECIVKLKLFHVTVASKHQHQAVVYTGWASELQGKGSWC